MASSTLPSQQSTLGRPSVAAGPASPSAQTAVAPTVMLILGSVSIGHMLNDTMQSVLLSIYPLLKESLALDFLHIGIITLVFQLTASILQPFVGLYTDKHPMPFSLPVGMASTFCGILLLAFAHSFIMVLLAASLIGIGSSIFHPEASRVARLASGGKFGFAQSLFQVGGNFGQAVGPLLVALIVIPRGQADVAWFAMAAVIGMVILGNVGRWYGKQIAVAKLAAAKGARSAVSPVSQRMVVLALSVLVLLTFSKNFYMAGFSSYYTFYLIDRFGVSVQSAQIHLFLFLGAVAAGTILGGPIGDRVGRRFVLWFSILGVLPFTLALPYANLFWTDVLAVVIGLIMASAFPAIIVYAQELLPGRVGMVAGLFFGFAFGIGGIGAAALGGLADMTSIGYVFQIIAFLPLLGILTVFLPDLNKARLEQQLAAAG